MHLTGGGLTVSSRIYGWLLAFAAALAFATSPAAAGLLSSLIKAGEKAAVKKAGHAARLAGVAAKGAKVAVRVEGDAVAVTAIAAGGVAGSTYLFLHADDLVRALSLVDGPVYLPVELVRRRPRLAAEILEKRPDLGVIDDAGEARLSIARRAGRPAIVVEAYPGLTMSLDAWARRGLLQQSLMRDLAARMRVIAIVDRTDQAQRAALKARLGKFVVFVESETQLTRELGRADRRLVAVVGHVEGMEFVLRDAGDRVVVRRGIDGIHSDIDKGESIGLMVGCDVACNVGGSGPTRVIDALRATEALAAGAAASTPLEFLRTIAAATGPLHVETDVYGRLRAVSAANVRAGDRMYGLSRVLFARAPRAPTDPIVAGREALNLLLVEAPLALIVSGLATWLTLTMLGVPPRKTWRLSKEHYACALGRPEQDVDAISATERALLLLLGPIGMVARTCVKLTLAFANATLGVLGTLLMPLLGKSEQVTDADLSFYGARWLGEGAERRVPAAAVLVAGAAAVPALAALIAGQADRGWLLLFVAAGLLVATLALRRERRLVYAWPTATALATASATLPFFMIEWIRQAATAMTSWIGGRLWARSAN